MPASYLRRGAALIPGQSGRAAASPVYVDSATGRLKIVSGSTGVAESAVANEIPQQTSLLVDGAVSIAPGVFFIDKAGVYAGTVAAPTAAQAGTRMTFISTTDNAHTLTFPTNTLNDGTTGINELITFPAFAGAAVTIVAKNLLWYVESFNAVVITSTV